MPYKTHPTFAIRGPFCLPPTFREQPENYDCGSPKRSIPWRVWVIRPSFSALPEEAGPLDLMCLQIQRRIGMHRRLDGGQRPAV